jgi:phosphatidylinositol alpha-1,6-mannosyltransferase
MPRVLVLTPDFPPKRGGIETLVHRLVVNWQRCEPRVVTLDHDSAGDFDRSQPFHTRRVKRRATRQATMLLANVAALQEALRQRPDVVLSAHVVTSPGAQLVGRLLGIPLIQYVYGLELMARPRLAAFAVRGADVVLAISRHTHALALAAGADRERVEVIPPGVDAPQNGQPTVRKAPRMVTVAQLLYRYKGHDVVTRAMPLIRAVVPDVEWVVIGDGPIRRYLESMIRSHGVASHVRILGSVPDAQRDEWLDRSSVMVMPSRIPPTGVGGEGYGIVFSEAAIRGLPVVAGDVGGTRDAVSDGVTGVLVDPTDHVAVAGAVISLLQDREKARAMGEAARIRAAGLAWPHIAARVEDVALALAREKRRASSGRFVPEGRR